VAKGDHVSGDFNKPGRATIQDKENNEYLAVFVDDYQLSKTAVTPRIATYCRP
jgi:hypothetical protein